MSQDVVIVVVKGVLPTANGCAVFLGDDSKIFAIYVDQYVGHAIQMTIDGVKKERPLTHDLIGNIMLGLDLTLDHIVINDANEESGTYFARIILRMENELGKKIIEIDARPSDSIVLALQQKRPILVSRAIFEAAEDRSEILKGLRGQADDSDESSEPGEDGS